jgi:enterochelin esterase-like enzyme
VFHGAALGRDAPVTVFVPPGYDDGEGPYPVLYMLHGMGGRRTEWREIGLFDAAVALVAAGEIDPFLIVLPRGDQGYWLDHHDGPRWGSHVATDLVQEVDARYRTVADRASRAVGGLSMGAAAALQLGVNRADVFGVVGAHTPTLRDFAATWDWFGEPLATAYFGDRAYFDRHDPAHLYYAHGDVARTLRRRVDVGADDPWRQSVEWFRARLLERGVPHELAVLDGAGHGREDHGFWTRHLPETLRYYHGAFAAGRGSR